MVVPWAEGWQGPLGRAVTQRGRQGSIYHFLRNKGIKKTLRGGENEVRHAARNPEAIKKVYILFYVLGSCAGILSKALVFSGCCSTLYLILCFVVLETLLWSLLA